MPVITSNLIAPFVMVPITISAAATAIYTIENVPITITVTTTAATNIAQTASFVTT
jgi:hypothetical protein